MAELSPVLQQSNPLAQAPTDDERRRMALFLLLTGAGQAGTVNGQMAPTIRAPEAAFPSMPNVRQPGDRPERPRPGGGDIGALLSVLGGPTAVPGIIGSLVASDAMGRSPDPSLLSATGVGRLISERSSDTPDRGRVSRPDRIRSSSNREAGGGFTV